MFLEIVHADGLAHLSYLVGDGGRAAVIDPRRDSDPSYSSCSALAWASCSAFSCRRGRSQSMM